MALISRVSRAVEIIVSLTDKISAPAKKVANSFKQIGDQAQKGFKRTSKEADKAKDSVGELGGAVSRLRNALSGIASGVTIGAIVSVAASFEKLAISLRSTTGSAEEAEKRFQEIREFARTVPLGVDELTQAFIKLQSRGLDPSIEALESYGNTAAALGKTLDQFIEAVADAATFQFERLREFGITASQSAESVAFTFRGATTSVNKDADSIRRFLEDLGRTQFAGGLTRQMDTINGAASNLRDSFNELAVSIGEAGLSGTVRTSYRLLADAINDIAKEVRNNTQSIQQFFTIVNATLTALFSGIKIVANGLQLLFDQLRIQFNDFFIFINEQLQNIPFGNISENAEREVARLRLINAQLRLERDENLRDLEDAFKKASGIFFDQAEVAEEAADRQNKAVDTQARAIEKYTSLLNKLTGEGTKAAEDMRTIDVLGPIQDAISDLDSGNFDAAIGKTGKLVETLGEMADAGKVSSAELRNLILRVQQIEQEALRSKGLGDALIGDEQEMKNRIDVLRQQVGLNPITADLQVNTAEAEAAIQALQQQPVQIPIQWVPVNNPNDVIYQEMLKSGDNG